MESVTGSRRIPTDASTGSWADQPRFNVSHWLHEAFKRKAEKRLNQIETQKTAWNRRIAISKRLNASSSNQLCVSTEQLNAEPHWRQNTVSALTKDHLRRARTAIRPNTPKAARTAEDGSGTMCGLALVYSYTTVTPANA